MDAGLTPRDVWDFFEVVDPFWNAQHQLGMEFDAARIKWLEY
jgi:hypothetical protein